MSNRLNYANGGAILADWIIECWGMAKHMELKIEGRELTPDEAAIDFLVQWISDDGSLDEFCRTGYKCTDKLKELSDAYCLQWNILWAWIHRSPQRLAAYEGAKAARNVLRTERLFDKFWNVANKQPEGNPSYADQHKSLEALAKTYGLFRENVSVTHTITKSPEELSDAELAAIATRGRSGTAQAQDGPPVAPSVH